MANILDVKKVKNIEFINRVVMAPMVLFEHQTKNGIMNEYALKHYLNRAETGIGLIISQSLSVTAKKSFSWWACVYDDFHKEYLKKIADGCHKNGTKFFAQLAYPGFDFRNNDTINNLTESEIINIQNEFINAAKICHSAGCDGVELHGAHGFFINLFTSSISNKRTDKYGGDINGRILFIKNIVEGIKEFYDDNFIISYRLGWDNNLSIDIEIAKALANIGVEMIHVSSGIPLERDLGLINNLNLANNLNFNDIVFTGSQIKNNINIPVITVNSIKNLNRGDFLIKNGFSDFVAYGKPFLADENFMSMSLNNFDYESCIECKKCWWFENSNNCPVQPKL